MKGVEISAGEEESRLAESARAPATVALDPALLDEIVRRVVEAANPDRIVLFGSAARGEMGPDSDVDLLVVKAAAPHRRRLAQEIDRALMGLEIGVDILVQRPEDVEYLKDKVGNVIKPASQGHSRRSRASRRPTTSASS